MNESDDEKVRNLLKRALTPMDSELKRGLWPEMPRKLDERTVRVPWFDWTLAALVVVWLLLFPQVLPILLYHL